MIPGIHFIAESCRCTRHRCRNDHIIVNICYSKLKTMSDDDVQSFYLSFSESSEDDYEEKEVLQTMVTIWMGELVSICITNYGFMFFLLTNGRMLQHHYFLQNVFDVVVK